MKYLFANWKTALSVEDSVALAKEAQGFDVPSDVELAFFPSTDAFAAVRDAVAGKFPLGAQDVDEPHGSEGTYVLVGHSDRRAGGDTDETVAVKMKKTIEAGVIPVLCVGETKAELDEGKRDARIKEQVASALTGVRVQKVFIVYEPVWAIGSGQNDTPEDTASAITVIDAVLKETSPDASAVFLYGGSVNPQNVASYTHLPALDGVLVGKAGTSIATLLGIMEAM